MQLGIKTTKVDSYCLNEKFLFSYFFNAMSCGRPLILKSIMFSTLEYTVKLRSCVKCAKNMHYPKSSTFTVLNVRFSTLLT